MKGDSFGVISYYRIRESPKWSKEQHYDCRKPRLKVYKKIEKIHKFKTVTTFTQLQTVTGNTQKATISEDTLDY